MEKCKHVSGYIRGCACPSVIHASMRLCLNTYVQNQNTYLNVWQSKYANSMHVHCNIAPTKNRTLKGLESLYKGRQIILTDLQFLLITAFFSPTDMFQNIYLKMQIILTMSNDTLGPYMFTPLQSQMSIAVILT